MSPISPIIIFIIKIQQLSVNGEVECDEQDPCVGLSLTADVVHSNAYKSVTGSNSSMNCTVLCKCGGSFGCESISFIKSQSITCGGDHSCHNIDLLKASEYIHCDGTCSCCSTIISSSKTSKTILNCDGDKSCSNSHISGIQKITISGAYGLLNSTIDSKSSTALSVKLYAYHAGFGAKIICQSNSMCQITCAGNACSNLFVNCIGKCRFYGQQYDVQNMLIFDSMYDSKQMSIEYDIECNEDTSLTFDSRSEIFDVNDTIISSKQSVCCRGFESCRDESGGTMIQIESALNMKYKVICSGDISCGSTEIDNYFGIVWCSGDHSCLWSVINSTQSIYCVALSSCYRATIYNTKRLICGGHQSCQVATVYSSGSGDQHFFYFLGLSAAKHATIYCNASDECMVFCRGKTSCAGSSIICDEGCRYAIECDEDSECPKEITSEPTKNPTMDPTQYLIITPSTSSTIAKPYNTNEHISYSAQAYVGVGIFLIGCGIITPLILIIFAHRFHRKRRGTDRPGYISLIRFFGRIADLYTDVFWAYSLYVSGHCLWITAFIFVFGSHFVSIVICIYWITKWRQNKHNTHVAQYAHQYDTFVICLSVVSGFYGAVALITSHLFHLEILSLCLEDEHLSTISTIRTLNNSLLENIPALIIQILYINSSATDFITLLAMFFTIISILAMLFTLVERFINHVMNQTATKLECALNEVVMQFILQSEENDTIKSYHIHSHYLIANAISTAFQIEMSQIKIQRIQKISHGIKVNAALIMLKDDIARNIMNGLNGNNHNNRLYCTLLNDCTDRLGIRLGLIALEIVHIALRREKNDDADQQMMLQNVEMRQIDWNTIDCHTVSE